MPCIKMRTDTAEPRRISGKLYQVTQAEGWELVSGGVASWKYVPQSEVENLTAFEPSTIKGALRPVKPRPASKASE